MPWSQMSGPSLPRQQQVWQVKSPRTWQTRRRPVPKRINFAESPVPIPVSTPTAPIVQTSLRSEALELLHHLGVPEDQLTGGSLPSRSPITGELLASLPVTEDPAALIQAAHEAFLHWRTVPMPRRGELVRLLAEELRANLEPLGRLVTLEAGKILSEGRGEVQEMIDICTYAAGLSRTIGGVTVWSPSALTTA